MEAGFIVVLILVLIVGGVSGFFIGKTKVKRKYERDTQYTQGTLNVVYDSSETQPGLFLALSSPVNEVVSRNYVKLDVNLLRPNSRK